MVKDFLIFGPGKCSGCGACIATCPTKAVKPDKNKLKFDFEKCTLCMDCLEICPKDAISLSNARADDLSFKVTKTNNSSHTFIFSKASQL